MDRTLEKNVIVIKLNNKKMCEKIANFKIANFLGFNYASLDNVVFKLHYKEWHEYHKSMYNLLTVIIRIKEKAADKWNSSDYKEIREAFVELDKEKLFKAIGIYLAKTETHV